MLLLTLVVALVLAWPTMGLSLVVWFIAVWTHIKKERRLNEFRDARRVESPSVRAPRPDVIETGIRDVLESFATLEQEVAAVIFTDLDVIRSGVAMGAVAAASYLKRAATYGLANIDALTRHFTALATVTRQRPLQRSEQEAGFRSIIYWCIENAARADPDVFYFVDIAQASRKGAAMDQKMLG